MIALPASPTSFWKLENRVSERDGTGGNLKIGGAQPWSAVINNFNAGPTVGITTKTSYIQW